MGAHNYLGDDKDGFIIIDDTYSFGIAIIRDDRTIPIASFPYGDVDGEEVNEEEVRRDALVTACTWLDANRRKVLAELEKDPNTEDLQHLQL